MSMNKLPWLLALFVIILSLVAILFLPLGIKNRLDTRQSERNDFLTLADKKITQGIKVKHDQLNIIILNFRNPNFENHSQFRFQLLSESGEIVVDQLFSGYNLGDPSDLRFQFSPIQQSKEKDYSIILEALSPLETPPVSVAVKTGNLKDWKPISLSDGKIDKTLSFSAYYHASNKKVVMVDFIKGIISKITDDYFFFIGWFLALALVLIVKVRNGAPRQK